MLYRINPTVSRFSGKFRVAGAQILFVIVLLFLFSGAIASEISVPLKLDYKFLRRMLLEQIYTDQYNTARLFDEQTDCSTLVLSDPRIGPDAGRIRIVTAVEAKFGRRIAGHCWHLPKWQGFIEVFQQPRLVSGQPTIAFQVVDSNLLDLQGDKPLITGTLWDWVTHHIRPRLAALKVDLATPLQEVQALIPLMLVPASTDAVQRTLESATFSGLEIADEGIILTLQFSIPEMVSQPVAQPAQPALTSDEAQRWEAAWQRWDAFLTFVIKQVAEDTEQPELRRALLEVLLDGRYDLTEALISWKEGTADPVRSLFLKSWERLSPILQQMETTLPGTEAIRYISFITAADALNAMDQVSEQVGYEISADGLRRLARMLAPELEEDPLIYRLEVDPELRQLFEFGAPLPMIDQPHDIDGDSGTWFFFAPAWAAEAPNRTLVKKLNRWVPDAEEIESYLHLVEDLLDHTANATVRNKDLATEYHDFFRHLSLATAWQESCWRQFVKKSGRLLPLTSPAGAVGIMQVNPKVWRGFYEIPALRSDISYNASAGNEILHHYLVDYIFAKGEHKRSRSISQLARLTYVTYNGGPGYLERYRKKSAPESAHQVATSFWRKYQGIKANGASAVASCYGRS